MQRPTPYGLTKDGILESVASEHAQVKNPSACHWNTVTTERPTNTSQADKVVHIKETTPFVISPVAIVSWWCMETCTSRSVVRNEY